METETTLITWIIEYAKEILLSISSIAVFIVAIKKEWYKLISMPTTKKQNEIDFAKQAQEFYNQTLEDIRSQIEKDRKKFEEDRQRYEAEILTKDKLLKESLGDNDRYKRLINKHTNHINSLEKKLIDNNIEFKRFEE